MLSHPNADPPRIRHVNNSACRRVVPCKRSRRGLRLHRSRRCCATVTIYYPATGDRGLAPQRPAPPLPPGADEPLPIPLPAPPPPDGPSRGSDVIGEVLRCLSSERLRSVSGRVRSLGSPMLPAPMPDPVPDPVPVPPVTPVPGAAPLRSWATAGATAGAARSARPSVVATISDFIGCSSKLVAGGPRQDTGLRPSLLSSTRRPLGAACTTATGATGTT